MNWDWEKLQSQRRRQPGYTPPDMGEMGEKLKRLRIPGGGKLAVLILLVLWALSGIYIVQPDEVGVVKRFGAFHRQTPPGPHIHWPFPVESVLTPKVTEIRRVEVGFRSGTPSRGPFLGNQARQLPDESLMLTGDENIVDVQFIVQYQIKDPVAFLFNVAEQAETIKRVAEAAMREVIGNNKIDSALTTGKVAIQNETETLMQDVLDRYNAGLRIVAVQLQDVQPPKEVIDAFKDVASAREDRARFINEAEAYRNDILPKARGQASVVVNEAQAYEQSQILGAKGGAERFLKVLTEYQKAPEETARRLKLEAQERIFSQGGLEKLVLPDGAASRLLPWLPLPPPRPAQPAQPAGGGN
jgi:membrane protease subunit HflK